VYSPSQRRGARAGLTYSRFIEGLKSANIGLDRKVLSDIAVKDEPTFAEIISKVRTALEAKKAA
jgi:large subunit ribosomal protein L20